MSRGFARAWSRRPVKAATALLAVSLLVAGCSSQPGSAATVAGTAIPEQSVLNRTNAFLEEAGTVDPSDVANSAQVDLINRQQATDLIRHQLVLFAEGQQQFAISQSDINALISAQGGATQLGQTWEVPSTEVADLAHDLLVLEKLLGQDSGAQFTDVSVTLDYLTATSRDAAVAARAKYLSDPAALTADIAAASAGGQAQSGAAFQFSTNPALGTLGLYSAPVGSIIIAQLDASTFLVAKVVSRTEKPTTLTTTMLSSLSSASDQLDLASVALTPYEAQAGVTLNPRFGQWDSTTLQAVPNNDGL